MNLLDLSKYYGFEPRLDAGGRHKMCCPFHNENSASFVIYPNNSYYCFGCASAGKPINFIMAQEKKTYDEVIEMFKSDVDVQSTKFFTEVIVKKFDKDHFDLDKYKKNSQFQLGMHLRDRLYTSPELRDKIFGCYMEMDVFFNNSSIEDSKYVDEFVDSILEKF
jgi:hypothetical protein